MDQRAKRALAIFCIASQRLEGRRKVLLEIEKKAQETIAECKKRIEEVKLKKKWVPLFPPRFETLLAVQEEPNSDYNSIINGTVQGEPPKEVRKRGRRKGGEKAIEKTTSNMKTTKLRKRASDDDLLEEQPLSKIRREVTAIAVQNTHKKTSKDVRTTFTGKESMLNTTTDCLDEKEKNVSIQINSKNVNVTVVTPMISNCKEVTKEEKLITETNNVSELNKNLCSFTKSDDINKIVPNEINKSNQIIVGNDKSNCCKTTTKEVMSIINGKEKTIIAAYPSNSIIVKTNSCITNGSHTTKNNTLKNVDITKLIAGNNSDENEENKTFVVNQNNGNSKSNVADHTNKNISILSCEVVECRDKKDLEPRNNKIEKEDAPLIGTAPEVYVIPPSPSIHVTRMLNTKYPNILSSDDELYEDKTLTRSKAPLSDKKKVSPTSAESTSSCSEEIRVPQSRITRSKKAKHKEALKPDINCGSSASTEKESAPVIEIRMTRSKMAKPKKENINTNNRSGGEESGARNELISCSDGETGKKKVKDIIKMINDRQAMVLLSPINLTKEQEKENQHAGLLRLLDKKDKRTPSIDRKYVLGKTTPLQVRNAYITPNKKPVPVINSATRNKTALDDAEKRKKEEEARRKREKEEEVLRKKQERLKAKQEELKKRHEEKMSKVAAMREAAEKEKLELFSKQEKEREEKDKIAKAEIERKKMEEAHKKKMANQTKAAEVETRRLKEEAARKARLKEMEEEQRLQEELRQRQIEENERILKLRQEEIRAKEKEALKQKELLKKKKAITNPLKDKDNYSITADLAAGDDDDEEDEEISKKEYPGWTKKEDRLMQSRIQVHCPMSLVSEVFCFPSTTPDLTDIFGKMTVKRIRSSSAVWLDSPPVKVNHPTNNS